MLAVTCVVHSATMSMVRELRRVRVAGPASVRSLTQSPCVSHLSGHRPRPPTRPCAPRAGRRISAGRWVVGPRPRPVFYLNVAAQVSSKRTRGRAARRRKPRRRAPAGGDGADGGCATVWSVHIRDPVLAPQAADPHLNPRHGQSDRPGRRGHGPCTRPHLRRLRRRGRLSIKRPHQSS